MSACGGAAAPAATGDEAAPAADSGGAAPAVSASGLKEVPRNRTHIFMGVAAKGSLLIMNCGIPTPLALTINWPQYYLRTLGVLQCLCR
ncbi:MAG: hypothetical protein R2867_34910 [Caldilineaceae bacterium]